MLRSLLLAAVIGLVGCGTGEPELDCFDQGPLEASYRDGEARADLENREQFATGERAGLALTYADGEVDGAQAGFTDGYIRGYDGIDGYPAGYADGYDQGRFAGETDPNACNDGGNAGYADGDAAGYTDSYDAGYSEGYSAGGADGYSDGVSTCERRVDKRFDPIGREPATQLDLDPAIEGTANLEELRVCFARGYGDVLDPYAFDRGFEAGKAKNPDYQAGFAAAYPAAFARGEREGMLDGYDDGLVDGYAVGYDDGYLAIYDACYVEGWDQGYEAGYGDGWEPGWSAGYADGYNAGFDDGDDCE